MSNRHRMREHTGAERSMRAGSGASGLATEGSARECEARLEGRQVQRAEKIVYPVKSEIFAISLNRSLASYLFTIRPLLDRRRR